MENVEEELKKASEIEDERGRFTAEINIFKKYFGKEDYLEAWRVYNLMLTSRSIWNELLNEMEN